MHGSQQVSDKHCAGCARTGGLGLLSDLNTPASKPGMRAAASELVSNSVNSGPMTCATQQRAISHVTAPPRGPCLHKDVSVSFHRQHCKPARTLLASPMLLKLWGVAVSLSASSQLGTKGLFSRK